MKTHKFLSDTIVAIIDEDGISRGSCSIHNPIYKTWVAGGGIPAPADPPTPEEIAVATKVVKDDQDVAAANSYGKLTALKTMSPAEIQAWVAANVTNLAQAQDAIATLAIGVGILARRL